MTKEELYKKYLEAKQRVDELEKTNKSLKKDNEHWRFMASIWEDLSSQYLDLFNKEFERNHEAYKELTDLKLKNLQQLKTDIINYN